MRVRTSIISQRSAALSLGVLLLVVWSVLHRKDEVTVYPVACVHGYVLDNACYGESAYTLNRSRYTALVESQLVMEQFDGGAPVWKLNDRDTACSVRDARNWTCQNEKEGISETMQGGVMHHWPENHRPEGTPDWENTFYVRWWQWYCLSGRMVTPAANVEAPRVDTAMGFLRGMLKDANSCFTPLYPLSLLAPNMRAQLRAKAEKEWAADRPAMRELQRRLGGVAGR